MPRKPRPSEFLYCSKRFFNYAFIFWYLLGNRIYFLLPVVNYNPERCIPAPLSSLYHTRKIRFFRGSFYPFPMLFISIFFPPVPPGGNGGALCLRGWDGSPRILRASPAYPRASPAFLGGSPRRDPPSMSPPSPPRGSLLCPRSCALRGGGCAGLRQNNGRGGEGGGRSPRRIRAPARSASGRGCARCPSRPAQTHQFKATERPR